MPLDERPLSELPVEELKARLEALRARRAQPRGTSAAKTPGVVGPGETTPRRGGGKRRSTMNEDDFLFIAESIMGPPKEDPTDGRP